MNYQMQINIICLFYIFVTIKKSPQRVSCVIILKPKMKLKRNLRIETKKWDK